ncbi:MAG TPA: hypothetical protein ENI08_01200, partial [Candidatus Dependentiae bacterium]|nr:hypothetical protein [Candidatus Dependentiae bacterium]
MVNKTMLQKIKIINWFSFLWLLIVLPLYPFVKPDKDSRETFGDYMSVQHSVKQRFEKKIAAYINELQRDLSHNYSTIVTLRKVLLQVQNCKTLKQALVLLNKVDDPFIKKHKEIECALLVQASVVLGNYTNEMLLDLLAIIDSHLSYWQKMHDYPHYYFFHKSPLKWVIGKNQQQEINENIQVLYAIQQKYLKILGALTKHAQQFNDKATIDEHYTWIGQFITIVHVLYMRQFDGDIIDHEHAMHTMKQTLKNALIYRNYALFHISKVKPHHHFEHNWLKYSMLLIGVGIAYKNRRFIDSWLGKEAQNQYKKSVYRAWHEYFINPLQGAYDAIMISKEQKKLNIADGIQEQEVLIEQNKKLLAEQKDQVKKDIEDMKRGRIIVAESIKKDLQQGQEAGRLTSEQSEKIWCAAQKDDIGPFQQYANNLPKIGISLSGIESARIQALLDYAQFIIFNDRQKVLTSVRNLLNHAEGLILNADEALIVFRKALLHVWDNELKKNQMTLRFTALIPAMVTGWSLYKLTSKFYTWVTRRNYSLLRNIMAQVNAMLIEFRGDMNNECYGNLVYLLHKLKRTALNQISQKNIKREFLRDIEMLSWYDYTIEEKRLLIDNMRWKYDFLSPACNG